jgi:hypothetical protein
MTRPLFRRIVMPSVAILASGVTQAMTLPPRRTHHKPARVPHVPVSGKKYHLVSCERPRKPTQQHAAQA